MRQLIIIAFIFFNNLTLFSQNDTLKELIISSLKIYELNPIEKEKSENLNKKFAEKLRGSDNINLMEMFGVLYDNTYSVFEDNDDLRRTKMRLCICYAIISILSEKDKFEYFLNLARSSVSDSTGKSLELLEHYYCGLGLLDIYLKTKYHLDCENALVDLKNSLECYKAALPVDFYANTKYFLKKYKK